MTDVWTLLRARQRAGAGAPVVTFVDVARGQRTELSAASLENAAAKIANALREEFELEPGDVIGVHLPVHWQRAAWCAGAWTAGCVVAPGEVDAALVVAGPEEAVRLAARVDRLAVVSLHPFGMPIVDPLPEGAFDVTLAVRQQPDAYLFDPPSATTPALRTDGDVIDHEALIALGRRRGTDWGLAEGGRLLADDAAFGEDAWLAALAVPLACAASVVLVRGDGAGVAEQELVSARVGSSA